MIRLFLFLLVFITCLICLNTSLVLDLKSDPYMTNQDSLKAITFCKDCPDPGKEGSIVMALAPKYGIKNYHITGQLIYGIPNYGEVKNMVNKVEFNDRIVIVDRGHVNLIDKAKNIQNNGAAALIIADDGKCDEEFKNCGVRVGSVIEGGFAPYDDQYEWSKIKIPVLLVTKSTSEKFNRQMNIVKVKIPKFGFQNMTILHNPNDEL